MWRNYRNLENSMKEYIECQLSENNWQGINVILGYRKVKETKLPIISIYWDSSSLTRLELGSNTQLEGNLIMLDIYAGDKGEGFMLDLASFLIDILKEGFPYYEYYPNSENKREILKTEKGYVEIEFNTNEKIESPENADIYDRNRHRISLRSWIK